VQMKVNNETVVFVNVAYEAAMISFLREFKGLYSCKDFMKL